MFEWISSHHQIINALANVSMLIVWVAYLQVFVGSYRRQRRSRILVNRGVGSGLAARCLISNMSAEAIYIQSVIATLEISEERWTSPVTDLRGLAEHQSHPDLKLATRQGPLLAGYFMDIGTFDGLIDHVLHHGGRRDGLDEEKFWKQLRALEITVVAVHGPDDLLVGAKRRFDIARQEGELRLKAHTVDTEQIRSRRERRRIAEMRKRDL
ncbi:MAG TPA: hypothetical protein VFO41_08450 [Alphaproteobacteria bacterium]|nr:hypothetical protein [Alphaproteobacteria bacterium]